MESRFNVSTFLLQLLISVIGILYLVPTYIVINYAFKSSKESTSSSPFSLPSQLDWGNFKRAFDALNFWQSLGNNVIITATSVILVIILSCMGAYSISRGGNKFFGGAYYLFVAGILIPYQVIFVPIFLLGLRMGFMNSLTGVIFFSVATHLPFGVFVTTGFMNSVPKEVEEAASIDGCSVFKTFWIIILPMLRPVGASLTIIMSLQIWNDYLLPLLFLQKNELKTLTIKMARLFDMFSTDFNAGFAAIIVSSLPILILFIFMQKHFIKGITMGSVKG
ncbi:carbohydrate ABC transporter permease [Paenibacillus piri]|uniref:Carbohydrate ABC transporter permease n=1 Tax=Paenibacillus piri TaxID=2547395 RepID=A0A4R5KQD8_9BACL|nr:carbohydrate ABC transporter permease [Paenibacillus piri]TDF97188.1 carbohydrate ABC transporter permease [Paenibacillus piri]